jgi:hypothetical protein
MKHVLRALFMVLVLSAFMPGRSAAQGNSQPGGGQGAGFELRQNYPNPVNRDTRIPFVISDGQGCIDGRVHRVSLRIYNLLAQLIAVPVLQGGSGNAGGGESLENVQLTCSPSPYEAYWDGKNTQTGDDVASGIYLFRLEVDGKVLVKKMIVRK